MTKFIKELAENTSPSSTDAVEIDDGTNSEYVTLLNLLKGAVTPGTSGNILTSDGTTWTSAAASTSGNVTIYNSGENFYRCPTPGGTSTWTGQIESIAGDRLSLVWKAAGTTGTAAAMVVSSTGQLAKMRLYNTTNSPVDSALISQATVATRTIVFTAALPATWAINENISIVSQTVSGASLPWVDLEITDATLMGKSGMMFDMTIRSATVGDSEAVHPTDTYGDGKSMVHTAQVANTSINREGIVKITNNLVSFAWAGTAHTAIILKVTAYIS